MHRLKNMRIMGSGTLNGGHYHKVSVFGSGVISGDMNADQLTVYGDAVVKGNAEINHLRVMGMANYDGNLHGETVKNFGMLEVSGNIRTIRMMNAGLCHCHSVKAEIIKSYGELEAAGDVESEYFFLKGRMKIEGLLNANKMKLIIKKDSSIGQIGGEEITVRLARSIFKKERHYFLSADVIEGTHITLEHTHVNTVRGDQVIIGPFCNINLVEYKDAVQIDPTSNVMNKVKV